MKASIIDLKESISKIKLPAKIQQIHSSALFIVFKLRAVKKTTYLYLGRGIHYNGLWGSELPLPSYLRVQDSLLSFFRKRMLNAWILEFKLDSKYKKIELIYKLDKLYSLFLVFKDKDLYFAFNDPLFFSWKMNGDLDFFDLLEESNEKRYPKDLVLEYLTKYQKKEDQKQLLFLKRKREKIVNDILKLEGLSDYSKLENLNLLGLDNLELSGFKFKLNPKFNHYQNLNIVYTKIKSLKKAILIQKERLEKIDKEIELSKDKKTFIHAKIINPIKRKKTKFLTYKLDNFLVVLGRNFKENSDIRKNFAVSSDLWVHLKDEKGPHLFIRAKLEELDQDAFNILGSLLVSKTPKETFSLIVTLVKDILPIKGARKVKYANETIISCVYNRNFAKHLTKQF